LNSNFVFLQGCCNFLGVGLVLLRNRDDVHLRWGEPGWEFTCKNARLARHRIAPLNRRGPDESSLDGEFLHRCLCIPNRNALGGCSPLGRFLKFAIHVQSHP
jgi:hypothetical protein